MVINQHSNNNVSPHTDADEPGRILTSCDRTRSQVKHHLIGGRNAVARITGRLAVSHFPCRKVKLLPHVNSNRSTEIPMLIEGT